MKSAELLDCITNFRQAFDISQDIYKYDPNMDWFIANDNKTNSGEITLKWDGYKKAYKEYKLGE